MRKSGWGFFVLFLLVGLAGFLITHAQVYYRLGLLSAFLLAVSYVWSSVSLTGVELTVRNRSYKAHVGEVFDQVIQVTNRSFLPLLFLEVTDLSGLYGGAGSRLITWVGPMQTRTFTTHHRLGRRGFFHVGRKLVRSGDPLRFFFREKEFSFPLDLLVYPAIYPISAYYPDPAILKDGRQARKRSLEPTVQFAEIRPYVAGDDLKKIHWLSSRKLNKLMVREFEQYSNEESWCFLDAEINQYWRNENKKPESDPWIFTKKEQVVITEDTFEYCASIAASICHLMVRRNMPVGLLATTREPLRLSPEVGLRQESKLMELLALSEPNGRLSLEGLIQNAINGIRPGSTIFLLTTRSAANLHSAILRLMAHKCRPVLIQVTAPGLDRSDEATSAGRLLDFPVCVVPLGADIQITMEKFFDKRRTPNHAF